LLVFTKHASARIMSLTHIFCPCQLRDSLSITRLAVIAQHHDATTTECNTRSNGTT